MNSKAVAVAIGVTAVLSLNAGAVAGYLYAKSKLGDEFDERLAREVASAKKFYSKLHKREENDMPTILETAQSLPIERDAIQAMQRYQGNGSDTALDKPEPEEPEFYQTTTDHTGKSIENSVFDNQPHMSVSDYEDLIRNRTEEAPYIITLAEFMNNELGYEQDSVVYFQGDGILVDARDDVIADPDTVVGDDNLVKFGHFSGDPKVVYVRNDILNHEFEIVLHEGKYAFVVHGFTEDPEPETVEA